MTITIVGVRHHSPACARLVRHLILRDRPARVLIEGPSDFNGRLGELALSHQLPVAIFSYAEWVSELGSQRRSSYYPFAEYSPEWVALRAAGEVSAEPWFMDLPAQDEAFDGIENLYSDRHLSGSGRLRELAAQLGFDDPDALWDHLFEQPAEPDAVAPRLRSYFQALRADEAGSPSDQRREAFMAETIAWAAARGSVLVVTGGYHAPALERNYPVLTAAAEPPARPARPGRHGAYLVPFSFRRLDAFGGYAAGMPSPAYYQVIWERGPAEGPEHMLRLAVAGLRAKKQRISAADALAASTMTEGLRRLRGHQAALRSDLLDGLAGALIKESLVAPLPWAQRGVPHPRTHPLLLALVEIFAGDRRGALAPQTPRPPLLGDVRAELARVRVPEGRQTLKLNPALDEPLGRAQSEVLHRLRILQIPGVTFRRGPSYGRQDVHFGEAWELTRGLEFEPALIEAASFGATLESAALAKLEARSTVASAAILAEVVHDAGRAGIAELPATLLAKLSAGITAEVDLSILGHALAHLLPIAENPGLSALRTAVDQILELGLSRGWWLFETIVGADAPLHRGQVEALVALRDTARWLGAERLGPGLAELLARRIKDPDAPPYLRGGALGLSAALAELLGGAALTDAAVVLAFKGLPELHQAGDFLFGLFAVARLELGQSPALLGVIMNAVESLHEQSFLVALPSLRQAFNFFPPRERAAIADRVVERYGGKNRRDLLGKVDVARAMEGRAKALLVAELLRRYGLGEAP